MEAHSSTRGRSQKAANVEARRRLAERMSRAEEVLGSYLAAGDEIEAFRASIRVAEDRQSESLAALAGLVGRSQAAELAGVDEARVRSALARPANKARPGTPRPSEPQGHPSPTPPPAPGPVPSSVVAPGRSSSTSLTPRPAPLTVPG